MKLKGRNEAIIKKPGVGGNTGLDPFKVQQ